MNKIKQVRRFIKHHPSKVVFVGGVIIGWKLGRKVVNQDELCLWLDEDMYTSLVDGSAEFIRYELDKGPTFLVSLES